MSAEKKETGFRRFRHWLQRTWLVYFLAYCLIVVIDWMPLGLSRRFGALAGWIAYHLDRGHRTVCHDNLKLAFPEMSRADASKLLRKCYMHLGVVVVDTCHLRSESSEDLRNNWIVPTDGAHEMMTQSLEQGKGVIAITGHVGHWELVGITYAAFGHPLTCIARKIAAPRLDTLMTSIRTRHGNSIIYQEGALRTFFFSLRKKKPIGMIMDQYAGSMSPFIEFFGKPASTADTAARLHVLTGAPLLFNSTMRRADGKYVWRCVPVTATYPADASEDEKIRRVLKSMNESFEQCIRQYPEQWLWMHKRWKGKPAKPVAEPAASSAPSEVKHAAS
jgi:KDO2-lipid IV(A) lauroyltransferase